MGDSEHEGGVGVEGDVVSWVFLASISQGYFRKTVLCVLRFMLYKSFLSSVHAGHIGCLQDY